MVLTGIALQEGRHVAFLEDSAARQTKRLVPGDQVAGGTIAGVSFDSMEFDLGGKRIHIPVGRNLLGEIAPAAPAPVAEATSQPELASSGSSPRSAAERNGSSRDSRKSRDGNSKDRSKGDGRSKSDSRNGNGRDGNGRDSRDSRSGGSFTPPPRDNLRERDPAGPPITVDAVGEPAPAPASPGAAPGLSNDPNLSLEERMKLRAQQLRGENK
jgi:hypothetical protein